jgi:hypothetical protein
MARALKYFLTIEHLSQLSDIELAKLSDAFETIVQTYERFLRKTPTFILTEACTVFQVQAARALQRFKEKYGPA